MKVLIQWTQNNPEDWVELDLKSNLDAWKQLPKKPLPNGTDLIDDAPGWIFDICIQGQLLGGADHYAIEPIVGVKNKFLGIRAYRWNDDPEDWPEGTRSAQIWEFLPGWVDRVGPSGIRHQGPNQKCTIFSEENTPWWGRTDLECAGRPVKIKAFSSFKAPDEALIRHGIWVSDSLSDLHVSTQSQRSWREWL